MTWLEKDGDGDGAEVNEVSARLTDGPSNSRRAWCVGIQQDGCCVITRSIHKEYSEAFRHDDHVETGHSHDGFQTPRSRNTRRGIRHDAKRERSRLAAASPGTDRRHT